MILGFFCKGIENYYRQAKKQFSILRPPAILEEMLSAISVGEPIRAEPLNVTFYNSLQVAQSERYIFAEYSKFKLAKRQSAVQTRTKTKHCRVSPMNSDNYLNLSAHMRDKFVYRIISIERLFELFASRQNVLVKPKKWEDPFENFILRCRIQLPDGRYATFGFQDKFYAQCWTFQSASDAMWRIYSRTSDAVLR
jgi:hypothetical protein